jgi:hypothetical protein
MNIITYGSKNARHSDCAKNGRQERIDALGGWSAVQGAGRRYGAGYTLEQKRLWLHRIAVDPKAD